MELSRRNVPRGHAEPEIVLNVETMDAVVPFIVHNPPPEEMTISISIISNSRLLTDGLLPLLSPHLNLRLIGTHMGEFRVSSPLPNPPGHVVLLDIGVGREAAIKWTRYWSGLIPPAYVIILELASDITLILDCIEAGASGYRLQGASAVEVSQAINDALRGEAHCSPEITAQLYARIASLRSAVLQLSVSPLTARESEILCYIATGYTNLEIAAQLVIELRTVKQHVHQILRKLSVRSRGEAARLAAEQGWLEHDPATPLHRG
jgi:DNA-binding NarL/FixJ family response regulator